MTHHIYKDYILGVLIIVFFSILLAKGWMLLANHIGKQIGLEEFLITLYKKIKK